MLIHLKISQRIFGLRHTVADFLPGTTLDDFARSLSPRTGPYPATDRGGASAGSYNNGRGHQVHGSSVAHFTSPSLGVPQLPNLSGVRPPRSTVGGHSVSAVASLGIPATTMTAAATPRMANVVIAKNLNLASEVVQIQALELMRSQRILTSTGMQAAPRPFLLVAVVAAERGFLWNGCDCTEKSSSHDGKAVGRSPHMTAHLNDYFSIAHWHDPDDGFPNNQEQDEEERKGGSGEVSSDTDSVVRRSEAGGSYHSTGSVHSGGRRLLPSFSEADIRRLASMSENVRVDMEVLRYQLNVVAFLRLHRAVAVMGPAASGISCISPNATRDFEKLAQCLAPLHRLDYVTPALVALAAKKTYLHRIRTVPVGRKGSRPATIHERSMQWGSEKAAVEVLLEGISPEDVIDDVLASVVPPV